MEEKKTVSEKLKENKEYIVKKKEHYYDIMIDKLHLSKIGLDIFVILLIIIAIVIIFTQGK